MIDLIADSCGLAVVREVEPAAAKYGGNWHRGWKKLHLGVDACGEIVAQALTGSNVYDGTVSVEIIDNVHGRIRSVTPDAG